MYLQQHVYKSHQLLSNPDLLVSPEVTVIVLLGGPVYPTPELMTYISEIAPLYVIAVAAALEV